MLSSREQVLFARVVAYAWRHTQSCPDVGWGPSLEQVAREEAAQLPFEVLPADVAAVCELVQRIRRIGT